MLSFLVARRSDGVELTLVYHAVRVVFLGEFRLGFVQTNDGPTNRPTDQPREGPEWHEKKPAGKSAHDAHAKRDHAVESVHPWGPYFKLCSQGPFGSNARFALDYSWKASNFPLFVWFPLPPNHENRQHHTATSKQSIHRGH